MSHVADVWHGVNCAVPMSGVVLEVFTVVKKEDVMRTLQRSVLLGVSLLLLVFAVPPQLQAQVSHVEIGIDGMI